jgi:CRISPR-associated endonuclease/helicase Cas3
VAAHHGRIRPSMPDHGFDPELAPGKQREKRLEAVQRFSRLQELLGPWRLAYLEALLKAVDVAASGENPLAVLSEELGNTGGEDEEL